MLLTIATGALRRGKTKRLLKTGVEVVNVVEILAAVLGRLPHPPNANQVEDDLAEIAGGVDSPIIQHRLGHIAVLLQGEGADGLAQLLARHVPLADAFFALAFLLLLFLFAATGIVRIERLAGDFAAHPQHVCA